MSWFSKKVKSVTHAVTSAASTVARPVARAAVWTGGGLQRGIGAASRIPGVGTGLTIVTGGAAYALADSATRKRIENEMMTEAAIGVGALTAGAASKYLPPGGQAGPAAEASPGGLDAIDAGMGTDFSLPPAGAITRTADVPSSWSPPAFGGTLPAGTGPLAPAAGRGGTPTVLLAGGLGVVLLAVLAFALRPVRRR
jgi:hypothetical protein